MMFVGVFSRIVSVRARLFAILALKASSVQGGLCGNFQSKFSRRSLFSFELVGWSIC